MRLGLCCLFRDQPIKFVTTTATSIGKMKRSDALAKLSRLCLENADALLVALRFCADNGIGCFRINSQILPIKTHPTCGYEIDDPGGWPIIFCPFWENKAMRTIKTRGATGILALPAMHASADG